VLDRLASVIDQSQAAGRISNVIHPHVAAAALVAILERLSAHFQDLRTFKATRKHLVETCSRILHQTMTGVSLI